MKIVIKANGLGNTPEYKAYKRVFSSPDEFVYKRWFSDNGFMNFKEDILPPHSHGCSFVKIDITKPFSPTNYKWEERTKKIPVYTIDFIIDTSINLNNSGTYRITFDNGCFYIGSTKSFRKRISCFKGMFNGTGKMHNKKVIQCIVECNSVRFEVIEIINDQEVMKDKETLLINSFIGNPLLLNRSFDAHSNKGIRWTEEEKINMRQALRAKYKKGLSEGDPYKYYKTKRPVESLFISKYFGDKE